MVGLAWHYFAWHYTRGLRDFLRIWGNVQWFVWHFFSVGLLLSTLFMPFRRIRDERRKKGFDVGAFAESVVVNVLMRIVGFFVRSVLILAGLVVSVFVLLMGVTLFVSWLFAPALYLLMMVTGFFIVLT